MLYNKNGDVRLCFRPNHGPAVVQLRGKWRCADCVQEFRHRSAADKARPKCDHCSQHAARNSNLCGSCQEKLDVEVSRSLAVWNLRNDIAKLEASNVGHILHQILDMIEELQ